MFHRRVFHMFPRGKNVVLGLLVPYLPKSPSVTLQRFGLNWSSTYKPTRTLHTGMSLMDKVLTVDEIFARRSLQDYLRKQESDYGECMKLVNNNMTDQVILTQLSRLEPLIHCIKTLETKQKEMAETESLLKDEDPDMRELAHLDRDACLNDINDIRQTILGLLIPEDEIDHSDLVLEVTAGVGGQEAMLFTAEVFDMYQGFAQYHGWAFDVLEYMTSEIGGLRHASASISGPQSYQRMKFEAGVHRVQRVPKTEKQGRIHTSTMTVVVLPQPTEISFTINPKDLKMETKRASGAGGQHVNTTDSAVRIVHLPTGVVAECQQERSQIKNKETAMKLLRAKLFSMRLEEETSKRYNARKVQIGTKARSEKIRTYNFAQDRITDHRVGKSLHSIRDFLLGEELLEEMNSSLEDFSNQETLMDLLGENDY